jgi:hypothetical protein
MGIPVAPRNIFPSNIQGLPTWYEVRVTEASHLGARGGTDLMVAMNPQTFDRDIAGSATRGIILHKLMEEVLTGETQDVAPELERRATELLAQLGREPSADPKFGIAPKELAATIVRTLNLPEIATLRPHLTPENTVFGRESDGRTEILISGIADAVARDVK